MGLIGRYRGRHRRRTPRNLTLEKLFQPVQPLGLLGAYEGRHLHRSPLRLTLGQILAVALPLALFVSVFAVMLPSRADTYSPGCTGSTGDAAALVTAITTANSNGADDTITLSAACTYSLSATLSIASDASHTLTITGNGATLDGDPAALVVQVESGAQATLDQVTVTGGNGGD